MSDYYLVPEGLVLNQLMPREFFSKVKPRTKGKFKREHGIDLPEISEEEMSAVADSVSARKYSTFLLHAPSVQFEYAFVSKILHRTGEALILLPEVFQAVIVYDLLKRSFGERVCLLHGELSRGLRSAALENIAEGRHDIVVGTRTALFAPLRNLSFIAVLSEHSLSYKLEEGIRYSVRDTAVMRAFLGRATVLLSSIAPSLDSYFNALAKKFSLIRPVRRGRPGVKVIDMRFEKTVRPGLSKAVFEAAKRHLQSGKVIFVNNRRGYSSMLLCNDCGNMEKCRKCDIPLILHKDNNALKCHYCGVSTKISERCSHCGSWSLELMGAGTQRLQEYIKELVGIEAIRFDSDEARKKTDLNRLIEGIASGASNIIVGTKMMTRRISAEQKYDLVAVFNIDNSLNQPDFRAAEKTYTELSSLLDLAGENGEMMIQTRHARNPVFRYFKSGDYDAFARNEIRARRNSDTRPIPEW
jgi:primosomal protein N' (replication factor Y)